MKERLQFYILWARTHMEIVVLLFLVLSLLYVASRVYMEYNTYMSEPSPLPPWNPQKFFPNENYEKVRSILSSKTELEKDEKLIALGKFNMFDYKIVKERDVILKELDRKYREAERLYKEGNLKKARQILKEILVSWPTHTKSQKLLKEIELKLFPPTPTPSPTPPPRPPRFGEPGLPPELGGPAPGVRP